MTQKYYHKALQQPRTLLKAFATLIAAFALVACGDNTKDSQTTNSTHNKTQTLNVTTSAGDFADFVKEYIGPELEKSGYKVNLTEASESMCDQPAEEKKSKYSSSSSSVSVL